MNQKPKPHLYADLRYNIDEDRQIQINQGHANQDQRIVVDTNRGKLNILKDKNKEFKKKKKQLEMKQKETPQAQQEKDSHLEETKGEPKACMTSENQEKEREQGEVQDYMDNPIPSQQELRMDWPNFRI